MTINEERDIILNALYHHFNGDRIDANRLEDYLTNNTHIRPHRIYTVLQDLVKGEYVYETLGHIFHDFHILPKGESVMDEGGFSNKMHKEKPVSTININTDGGNIVGSQIGTSHSDLRSANLPISNNTVYPNEHTVNPNIKKRKWSEWINVLSIIVTIISIIIGIYTFYPKKQDVKLPNKSTSTTVKRL